jgi:hypothetical protein
VLIQERSEVFETIEDGADGSSGEALKPSIGYGARALMLRWPTLALFELPDYSRAFLEQARLSKHVHPRLHDVSGQQTTPSHEAFSKKKDPMQGLGAVVTYIEKGSENSQPSGARRAMSTMSLWKAHISHQPSSSTGTRNGVAPGQGHFHHSAVFNWPLPSSGKQP